MYVCSLCNRFRGRTFSEVLRHIGITHRFDPGLSILCGLKSCPAIYTNFESFRSHVYRKHRDELYLAADDTTPGTHSETSSDVFGCEDNDTFADEHLDSTTEVCDVKRHAAKFILKIKEECKLTQSSVDIIVSSVKGLWAQAMDNIRQKLADHLPDQVDEDLFGCPFEGLETQYLQQKYYQENFSYIAPVERVLGRQLTESNGKAVEMVDCCYDVPLHESLQALLRMDIVRDQVMNSHSLCNGLLGDYCDGELYSQHPLFREDPCALQIQLYFDELELCNPLGSKTHKLGLFYYTLGNLDPVLRSCLKSIHLLCVVKHDMIMKYGVEKVMEPIVESLMQLEKDEGVNFEFDGHMTSFRGTLTTFSADNLAAWSIGGFKALASAFRRCQFCMVTMDDMQEKFDEVHLQLRTKELYNSHCEGLDGPLAAHISTTYGVASNSILNKCTFFHVMDGLVPDIMHDVLEGSLALCVKHLLIQCIHEEQLFVLETLNQRLCSFNYGQADSKNRPSPILPRHLSAEGSLKQSACQMWCLGRCLPILIGDLIPEEHPYWNNFLLLLDIVNELFAPVTHPHRADYLSIIVGEFLEDFKELYPNRPLTPKMHYMVHMPTWTKRCGPLVRQWCMRYEAKHSYFKQLARVMGNFKNISKTLAGRHQHYMCYEMINPSSYLANRTTYTGVKHVIVDDLEWSVEVQLAAEELNGESEVSRVNSATINGTCYKKGVVVVCGHEDGELLYGKVLDLIITPTQECLFVMSLLETHHDHHYHCLVITSSTESNPNVLVCRYTDLIDHSPLTIYKPFGTSNMTCFCMKYTVLPK